MGEKSTLPLIECREALHIQRAEAEVPDVGVFVHALTVRGFGDGDNAELDEVAQGDLSDGFTVTPSDVGEDGVAEEALSPFGKGPPRHDLAAVLLHGLACEGLLIEDVGLDLVDHRADLAE